MASSGGTSGGSSGWRVEASGGTSGGSSGGLHPPPEASGGPPEASGGASGGTHHVEHRVKNWSKTRFLANFWPFREIFFGRIFFLVEKAKIHPKDDQKNSDPKLGF